MSFLERLRKKGIALDRSEPDTDTESNEVAQLNVDVFQTADMVVIYAQSSGADMNSVKVSIEGEADIILIEGKNSRPESLVFPEKKPKGSYFVSECVWGDFYRRIILPESVNVDKAEAKIKNGVLVLLLPLLVGSVKEESKLKSKPKTKSKTKSKVKED